MKKYLLLLMISVSLSPYANSSLLHPISSFKTLVVEKTYNAFKGEKHYDNVQSISNDGNRSNQSFSKAKKNLEQKIYKNHRKTIYCNASFNSHKKVTAPNGFTSVKYKKRAKKIEWEHVVAAENFGRNFTEWRNGNKNCVNSRGKRFKGRKCAEKTNKEYRYMQADMFNLFPAVGSVNALRSNYNFVADNGSASSFGSCDMRIARGKAVPPEGARGRIARSHLYMDKVYSKFTMSSQQRKLMNAWDKMYPVSAWECKRAKMITKIQKNKNIIVQDRCETLNLWK